MSSATVWTPPLWRPMAPAIELPSVPTPSQLRRTLTDPRVLTVLVAVALIFVIGFRQSIARAIGTAESTPAVVAPAVVHAARVATPTALPHQAVQSEPVVKLHPPRDPFLPMSGAVTVATATTVGASPAVATSTPVAGSYLVQPGDSLWLI